MTIYPAIRGASQPGNCRTISFGPFNTFRSLDYTSYVIYQLTDITLTSTHSGIHITQVVAGPIFNASTDDVLSLTDECEVYS